MAKRKAVKKGSAKAKKLNVEISLGPVKATEEQRARLRAYIRSHLLTWTKADVRMAGIPIYIDDRNGNGDGNGHHHDE
jgi:hypothetical protein